MTRKLIGFKEYPRSRKTTVIGKIELIDWDKGIFTVKLRETVNLAHIEHWLGEEEIWVNIRYPPE